MNSTKNELISGVIYTAISKYSGMIISLIIAGILARIISPEEFGIVAIATVIISFFSIFSDLGIAPAIIQSKDLSQNDFQYIYSFTIWLGIIISLLFFLLAWPISFFYNSKTVLHICHLLTINLFFASANIVPNALLYKEKEFKFIAYRSLIVQTIGGCIAISSALIGAGLYALIINPILSSILLFIISYNKKPQKLYLSGWSNSIKKIFNFTVYQFSFNIINYFSKNLDKLLIGKYMGMVPLGYYEKSYRLMMLPLQNITHIISPVMHPVFASYQDDLHKLSTSYEKIIRCLAFIGLPLSVFLWFTAAEVTLIIFGDQWVSSIPIFQILTLSVGLQIILSTSGSIYQAANNPKGLFICGVFSTVLNVAGILAGLFVFKTLEATAWCISCAIAINFVQCYLWMYKTTLKQSMYSFWKQFISPGILCLIIFVCLFFISYTMHSMPIIILFIIKGIVFTFVFLMYIQISKEYDIVNYIKSKIKK